MELSPGVLNEYALRSNLVSNPNVSFLAEGHGHYNYLVEERGKKFVLRLKKSSEGQFKDSLEREHTFLNYFEESGITFCPSSKYYDPLDNYLIESFLEGRAVSQEDFSSDQIDQYARQLFQITSLDISKFYDFCKKNNFKEIEPDDPIASLEKYGFNRFEEAKGGQVPEDVLSWIGKNLDRNLGYLRGAQSSKAPQNFKWGDVQSKVLMGENGEMSFYDFEHSGISDGSDLTYIKIHGKFSEAQFDELLVRYAYHSGESLKSILDRINSEERIIRVNDVVWAAMKWATTHEKSYEDLTYKRMKLVDEM